MPIPRMRRSCSGRWTAEAATIALSLAAQPTAPLILTLHLVPQHESDAIDLEINGQTLPRRALRRGMVAWTLRPELFEDYRCVRIRLRPTMGARSGGDAADRRVLGIAVRTLSLGPPLSLYRRTRGLLRSVLRPAYRRYRRWRATG